MEVAEGIPAPFPLVAHDPTAQPPRPPPRAQRQASRAATPAFTTCLLRDPPPPPTKAQDHGTRPQHPATGVVPAASDPMSEQHDGENNQGNADMHANQARLHCDGQREHVGSVHHHSTHAQPHVTGSSPTEEGAPKGPVEDLSHRHSAAERLTLSATHPDSAVGDPSRLHAPDARQPAQAVELHHQACEDFQERLASPSCQQQGYTGAEPIEHPGDMAESGEGAPPAYSQHGELKCHLTQPELQQQQQQVCHSHQYLPHAESDVATLQQQQHWHQTHMGGSQHDQILEQAANKSAAGGSLHQASCHTALLSSSDAVQPAPSTAALPALPLARPQPLVDPPMPLHLSRLPPPQPHPSAHPQPPNRPDHALAQAQGRFDTAGGARHESTAEVPTSHAAAGAASVGIASNEQRASATAAAAQPAISSGCLQAAQQLQQQRQPNAASQHSQLAHAVPDRVQAGSSATESLLTSSGQPDKVETCQPASLPQPAEEQFEQDELSQTSSSESDEDFQPSEYEQDELSQASSSSGEEDEGADDNTFEVDELSQTESSSADELSVCRRESAFRVQSPCQAPTSQGMKSPPKGALPASQEQSANPHSNAAAASGRSGVKRSREGSLCDDHKARLGFPKPAAYSLKDRPPGPQGLLKPSRLPFSSQDEPLNELRLGRKRPADGVAAQGPQKHVRTASPKVGAVKARRPEEVDVVQAQAAHQVSCHCKQQQRQAICFGC